MTITKDSSAPLVVVVGATGTQGGSVVRGLAESDKAYRIRATTRDATKPAAQALVPLGVEVVQVSLIVENKEEVFKAFADTDYAFLVTNFWDHASFDREVAEGKLLIDAAKAGGAKGIVWSGQASVSKLSNGKYPHVWHWDSKAIVTEYGLAAGVPFVEVRAGGYANVFFDPPFTPVKQGSGNDASYVLAWPIKADTKIAYLDVADYGVFVRHVLELETFPNGQLLHAYGEVITVQEIADQWAKGSGKNVQFAPISAETFRQGLESGGLPSHIVLDLYELFVVWSEIGFPVLPVPEGLWKPQRTWADYVKKADWSKILS